MAGASVVKECKMIKRLISEFYDEDSNQYIYQVRVSIFSVVVYVKQITSQRADLLQQFIIKDNKIGFRNESESKRDS